MPDHTPATPTNYCNNCEQPMLRAGAGALGPAQPLPTFACEKCGCVTFEAADPFEITEPYLLKRTWRFFYQAGNTSHPFRFLPEGKIGGYDNPNERRWRIESGEVVILNEKEIPTVRMRSSWNEGRLLLSGAHIPNPKIILCLTEKTGEFPQIPGAKAHFAEQIKNHGWEIGDHTYGWPSFAEVGYAKLKIGKYTSIASGVLIALGDHRIDTVSSYPFKTLKAWWPSVPWDTTDHVSKGDVTIGNDVWIGSNVFIGSGVTIGDGAVIGASSVITKSVPPYAVVVGNPGRVIRYRFPDDVIASLQDIAWWNWPDEVVDSYLPQIASSDIGAFIAKAKSDQRLRAKVDS